MSVLRIGFIGNWARFGPYIEDAAGGASTYAGQKVRVEPVQVGERRWAQRCRYHVLILACSGTGTGTIRDVPCVRMQPGNAGPVGLHAACLSAVMRAIEEAMVSSVA